MQADRVLAARSSEPESRFPAAADGASMLPTLPSVEEIWFIESRARRVVMWSRVDDVWIGTLPLTAAQSFRSRVLDAEIRLDDLYRNTEL